MQLIAEKNKLLGKSMLFNTLTFYPSRLKIFGKTFALSNRKPTFAEQMLGICPTNVNHFIKTLNVKRI